MKALLLCNYDTANAAMVTEHINAIIRYSEHDVYVYGNLVNNGGNFPLEFELDDFDAIIVHYSIFVAIEQYLSTKSRQRLAKFNGVKVVFLQDEYRFVDRTIAGMRELGADVLFSCVPEKSMTAVYPRERMGNIKLVNTLTGYPSDFLSILKPLPLNQRSYDVSYRGRRYPDWHGRMGREKFEIGEKFSKEASSRGLSTNISSQESDRLYGAGWVSLIQNSRAVLGVESGASVFDFSGTISIRTETVRALLGESGVGYEDLRRRYFADIEDTIDLAQISPRVFEAICLRSMCVLFEGSYSGILTPDVHYVALKKDFSNIDLVCKRIKDDLYVSEIISNAYADIAYGTTHTYRNFVRHLDREIAEAAKRKNYIQKPEPDVDSKRGGKEDFRTRYDRLYPFRMEQYPHSLSPGVKRGRRLFRALADRLPSGLKASLKALVK
jgi:hypothetical protein